MPNSCLYYFSSSDAGLCNKALADTNIFIPLQKIQTILAAYNSSNIQYNVETQSIPSYTPNPDQTTATQLFEKLSSENFPTFHKENVKTDCMQVKGEPEYVYNVQNESEICDIETETHSANTVGNTSGASFEQHDMTGKVGDELGTYTLVKTKKGDLKRKRKPTKTHIYGKALKTNTGIGANKGVVIIYRWGAVEI